MFTYSNEDGCDTNSSRHVCFALKVAAGPASYFNRKAISNNANTSNY